MAMIRSVATIIVAAVPIKPAAMRECRRCKHRHNQHRRYPNQTFFDNESHDLSPKHCSY
jgi:hypothetical protein